MARRPPKLLVQPLLPFVDRRFPGPEPRVSASLLATAIDLHQLHQRFVDLGCPVVLWQGQVLFCGSCEALGQQQCSVVFLPDGSAVCWHMSRETERFVLKLASASPRERRTLTRFGGVPSPAERMEQLGLSVPLATEYVHISDAPDGVITTVDTKDGSICLTRDPYHRTSHQLGLSLGMAVAVRLDALEKRIEARLEANWRDMHSEVGHHSLNLSAVSDRIFETEKGLHALRYELNSEAGLLDAPDLLWEHALAERLYDQVVAHFDVRRRTALLNERLSYSLDYLQASSEHVRHQYSVRLERIIIILIFLELLVGLAGAGHGGGHLLSALGSLWPPAEPGGCPEPSAQEG